jgi:hypothetical protein
MNNSRIPKKTVPYESMRKRMLGGPPVRWCEIIMAGWPNARKDVDFVQQLVVCEVDGDNNVKITEYFSFINQFPA